MELKLIKENEKGKTYQVADGFKICYRNKDTLSGDNDINVAEEIYLITGSTEITIEDKNWTCDAPSKIEIPAKTYHNIKALTDISFLFYEK